MGRMSLTDIPDGSQTTLEVLLTTWTTTATPTHVLRPRPSDSNSCPTSYEQCPGSKLPSNFCCPSSSTCISLDNGSSAICCPKGNNCSYIQPIPCDTSLQDPTLFPKNLIKTSRLNGRLPRCGSLCCPFGYTCEGGNTCAMEKRSTTTSQLSTTTSSSSTSSTSTTSTVSTIPTTTPTTLTTTTPTTLPTTSITPNPILATNCTTAEQPLSQSCPSFPSKAVVAGFFPGAIFGAVLALLILFLLCRRQSPSSSILPPYHKTSHYYANGTALHISEPIPSHESTVRTDFLLRRGNSSPAHSRSVLYRTGSRVKSLLSTPRLNRSHNRENDDDTPPLPPTPPSQIKVAPRQKLRQQPSTESIRVYSPGSAWPAPGIAALRLQPRADTSTPETTFSQMMDRAGFQDSRGDPRFRVDGAPEVGKERGLGQRG